MRKSTIFWLSILIVFLGLIVYYFYPESKLKDGQKADKIIINKSNHELLLYYKEELIARYKVALCTNGLNKKTKEGDSLTPEGRFKGKKRTQTRYHKAIAVGEWGDCCGVLIHGLGNEYSPEIFHVKIIMGRFKRFHRWRDWTKGCVALTNEEIDEIYKAVNNNVIIEINP
jgi:murein L,D-transpeptidase YafK